MAKGGKLTKLIKKISFGKTTKRNNSSSSSSSSSSDASDSSSATTLHPVYVGKSRRQYFLSPDVVSHPLLQQLAGNTAGDEDITVVGCEVVMFDHLLWMLENADHMPESMDELVDFYAC